MFWSKWKHITKLDPDRPNDRNLIAKVVGSGTDAVMISGTQRITDKNIKSLVGMLADYDLPRILEPATPDCISYDGVDHVFVPSVMNASDPAFVVGKHKEWVQHYDIRWDMVVPEAYIVLNPDSAVGRLTRANTELSADEVASYALCSEKYFKFPIIYVEYSGTYGDPKIVSAAHDRLDEAVLFYGGGITDREGALEMLGCADTIVVGNVLYDKGFDSFLETVP